MSAGDTSEGKQARCCIYYIIIPYLLLLDDVPPLEDMTEYVDKLKQHTCATDVSSTRRPVKTDSSLLQLEEDGTSAVTRPQLLVNSGCQATEKKKGPIINDDSLSKEGGFGGLKKGFLSGRGIFIYLGVQIHVHVLGKKKD